VCVISVFAAHSVHRRQVYLVKNHSFRHIAVRRYIMRLHLESPPPLASRLLSKALYAGCAG